MFVKLQDLVSPSSYVDSIAEHMLKIRIFAAGFIGSVLCRQHTIQAIDLKFGEFYRSVRRFCKIRKTWSKTKRLNTKQQRSSSKKM